MTRLLAPTTLTLRILKLGAWRLKIGWDDDLPDTTINTWSRICQQMIDMRTLHIPRCIRRKEKPTFVKLHVFYDASGDGFGAGIFLRSTYDGHEPVVRLIIGKARVALLWQLSIPRLELEPQLWEL